MGGVGLSRNMARIISLDSVCLRYIMDRFISLDAVCLRYIMDRIISLDAVCLRDIMDRKRDRQGHIPLSPLLKTNVCRGCIEMAASTQCNKSGVTIFTHWITLVKDINRTEFRNISSRIQPHEHDDF